MTDAMPTQRARVRRSPVASRHEGSYSGELDNPVIVDFPLRGEWTVERTPADRLPSHGTDALGMRYAYDFVRTDDRMGSRVHPAGWLKWLLIGGRTRDCYGWGQPVHAGFSGEVVDAVDGEAERQWLHPLREAWCALRTARSFRTRAAIDARRIAGNHVIIRSEQLFALYAHLAPGSVAVRSGQRISAGDVIGRVGHSGNSTAPHLHFQLMNSADVQHARGIPCAFSGYLVQRKGSAEHVRNGIPHRRERLLVQPRKRPRLWAGVEV